MVETLDRLWERIRDRSPRLRAADQTDDQTHTHHALVTVLVFGSMGVGLALMAGAVLPGWPPIGAGLRAGIVAGWLFYLARELYNRFDLNRRRFDWRYKLWDGVGDVLEPLWVTAPVVFHSIELLWALSAVFAAYYFLFRPIK